MLNHKRYRFKKLINILILTSVVLLLTTVTAMASSADENKASVEDQVVDEQSKSNEVHQIEEKLRTAAGTEAGEIIEGYDPDNIIENAAKGRFTLDIPSLLNKAARFLLKEIYDNLDILLKLVVLVIICAVLKNLQASFMSENVGELAFYICYIVLVSIIITSFNTALSMAMTMVDNMVNFMYATIPVLITLLISGGNITSGGIFQPVMIMVVEIAASVVKNIFIPLIFLSTVLSIVNNISDKVQLSRLAGLIKQIAGWALGLIMTVFIGIISVQGSLGAVIDGVTSKTAKYAIGAFIPVAGKYLADAADTVLGCALLIKNAAGLAVMIGVIAICLLPLLKIAAITALYKLACAAVEPIADKRITSCITDVSNSMLFILGLVASIAIMFLISVTVLISAGNLSSMIR